MLRLIRRLLTFFRLPSRAAASARSQRRNQTVAPDATSGTLTPLRERLAGATTRRGVARWRTWLASLAGAAGAALFGLLGWLVGLGALAQTDMALSMGAQQVWNPLLVAGMALVSLFGSPPLSTVIVLTVAATFWLAGYRVESLFAALAAVGVSLLGAQFKLLWQRPRPADDLVQVLGAPGGYSFPSGHTLLYVGFFGFLFYWSYAFLKQGRLRTALLWLFGLLIVLVGPSRIYLGHHWASDVLAAYGLGLAYLFVLIRLYRAVRLAPLRS